ncbi:MAG: 30S ribosomal protein S2 [Planctomycetes bacterium]|nr:30S ribosomal protein S2 [Planctomycetota bacterium]
MCATRRCTLSKELVHSLVDAGIHFGHRSSRWNPKMAPYIFGKRSSIHIIDVRETLKGIIRAKHFVTQVVAGGKDVLLVGTKRQARGVVERVATDHNMHYVNDRWLGGTLTNFRTIRSRLARLEELEKMQEDGTLEAASKKQGAAFRRELRKIRRNLQGIRKMERLPGVLVLVDQRREIIAIKEARKLGIPTICLLDTDCDPDTVDLPIPGNDDAMRAIELVIGEIGGAIALGLAARTQAAEQAAIDSRIRRRSARPVMGSAEGDQQREVGPDEASAAPAEMPDEAAGPETGAEGEAPAEPQQGAEEQS